MILYAILLKDWFLILIFYSGAYFGPHGTDYKSFENLFFTQKSLVGDPLFLAENEDTQVKKMAAGRDEASNRM